MARMQRLLSLGVVTILSVIMMQGIGWAAEKFPAREIVIVVAGTAGSSQDLTTRVVAEFLKNELKVPVVVENRAEAGGVKGIADVYKAKPDGYLLLNSLLPRYIQPEIVLGAPYKFLDMTYLGAFNPGEQLVVVTSNSPHKSLKELIEASKKKSLNGGIPGVGTLSHLIAMVLNNKAGLKAELVPFKGGAPEMMALLGGHIDVAFIDAVITAGQGNKVRPLAVSSLTRSPVFPKVPTFRELGIDVPILTSLQGIMAPPGMPEAITKVLSDALKKVVEHPDFIKKMTELARQPEYMSGPEFKEAAVNYYKLVQEYKHLFVEKK